MGKRKSVSVRLENVTKIYYSKEKLNILGKYTYQNIKNYPKNESLNKHFSLSKV